MKMPKNSTGSITSTSRIGDSKTAQAYEGLDEKQKLEYWSIADVVDGLEKYYNHRCPTGDFLRAVLENDFLHAFNRADLNNTRHMDKIAKYVYNHLPTECYGSKEKVRNWLSGGNNGK